MYIEMEGARLRGSQERLGWDWLRMIWREWFQQVQMLPGWASIWMMCLWVLFSVFFFHKLQVFHVGFNFLICFKCPASIRRRHHGLEDRLFDAGKHLCLGTTDADELPVTKHSRLLIALVSCNCTIIYEQIMTEWLIEVYHEKLDCIQNKYMRHSRSEWSISEWWVSEWWVSEWWDSECWVSEWWGSEWWNQWMVNQWMVNVVNGESVNGESVNGESVNVKSVNEWGSELWIGEFWIQWMK